MVLISLLYKRGVGRLITCNPSFMSLFHYRQLRVRVQHRKSGVRRLRRPVQHQGPFLQETRLGRLRIEKNLRTKPSYTTRFCLNNGAITSSVQVPWGYSPQVCVVINGHFVKPSLESSSFCRRLSIIDLKKRLHVITGTFLVFPLCFYRVPIGDVRNNSKSPRLVALIVSTA